MKIVVNRCSGGFGCGVLVKFAGIVTAETAST